MVEKRTNSLGYTETTLKTILLAGTLDIVAAFLDSFIGHGIKPIIVLQYITSAVWGQRAFSMGLTGGFVGLLFHYCIVTIWTLLFFLFYPKLSISARYKVMSGFAYGILIWLVMNLLVVPLSNTRKFPLRTGHAILGILYVMFCVGLPVSLMYHRFKKKSVMGYS